MGLFSLSSVSTNKRSTSTEPKFIVNAGTEKSKGGIKLNEAGARALNLEAGDYLAFVTDYSEVQKAIAKKDPIIMEWAEENEEDPKNYPVEWYVTKGWLLKNSDGTIKQVPERLTHAQKKQYEELGGEYVDEDGKAQAQPTDAFKGSKMNSQNGAAGFGILQGSDSTNWASLGGSLDHNLEYDIAADAITAEIDGEERELFLIENPTEKDKIVRG